MQIENMIVVRTEGDITLLDIQGDVTILSEPYFKKAYAQVNQQGASKLLLKFNGESYINSGGIVALSGLIGQARQNDQTIAITGLSSHFKKIFEMVGIHKVVKVYDSMEEALKSMSQ